MTIAGSTMKAAHIAAKMIVSLAFLAMDRVARPCDSPHIEH
jgi:hypothetical protein